MPLRQCVCKMIMLLKIAWRNVWRNRVRSLLVMGAVAVGTWSALFLVAFSWGMSAQRVSEAIENELGHFQVHQPLFKSEDLDINYLLPKGLLLAKKLQKNELVKVAGARLIVPAMIASATSSIGVQVNGIVPVEESLLTHLDLKLKEGSYFGNKRRNPIIVSQKMAERLSVKVKSKVVISFQDKHNNILAGAFRIEGLYKSNNSMYDEANVFVRREDLQKILSDTLIVNEIAVKLNDQNDLDPFVIGYRNSHPDLLIETWGELAPDLELFNTAFDQGMQIFVAIIMLALAFGILNTMLMVVLERLHEIGILMAIGMNKKRLFSVIMLETVLLTISGIPLGLFLGWSTIQYFGQTGIDLSVVGQGLESLGYGSIVYPEIAGHFYLDIVLQVLAVAMLSALYPASKALKLQPTEAIGKI